MSGLSNLGKALTAVFVVSLVAVLAEILFVIWHRRVFGRRQDSPEISGDHHDLFSSSSKELLYFLCLKSQCRIEPTGAVDDQQVVPRSDASAPVLDDPMMEVIDVFKLRDMSRFLFTIKEEEKEDLESEKSVSSSATSKSKTRNLSKSFQDTGASPEFMVTIDVEEEEEEHVIEEATPFSTPCASPLYFTPSASPVHGMARGATSTTTS